MMAESKLTLRHTNILKRRLSNIEGSGLLLHLSTLHFLLYHELFFVDNNRTAVNH